MRLASVTTAARVSIGAGAATPARARSAGTCERAIVFSASSTIAAAKNAADAFVNHARTTATPATTPQAGRRSANAYAAQPTTMNAVIVDSMSAARFHITNA